MYMFDMNRRYNPPIVPPIVPPIGDQTCTFQCIIPTGDLLKYDRRGRESPSGYTPLAFWQHAIGRMIMTYPLIL